MVPFAGWEMPILYSGVKAEHNAVRTDVGVFDASHMAEFEVTGQGALEQVDRLITNDLVAAEDGQAIYTCCCNDAGTIQDDLIVYRLSPERVLIVANASNHAKIGAHLGSHIEAPARVEDLSDQLALLAVQGPRALELLETLLGVAVADELRPFHTAEYSFDLEALLTVRVARTGYTGEDGAELFCPASTAPALLRRLLELGATPCGLAARDTLRLEACLRLYGNDIDETTTPLEAGLGWTVKFGKADFVGKAALEAQKNSGPPRKLVGFSMLGRGIARSGYPVLDSSGAQLGHCTSGSPSPTLGTNIGLAYMPQEFTKIGTEFLVDCRGKFVPAKVVTTPFYRRKPRDSSSSPSR
jgi:aminomethyltransferase